MSKKYHVEPNIARMAQICHGIDVLQRQDLAATEVLGVLKGNQSGLGAVHIINPNPTLDLVDIQRA